MQSMLPQMLLAGGLLTTLLLLGLAVAGPSTSKVMNRRIGAMRERYGSSTVNVEAQLRKAIANRPNHTKKGVAKLIPDPAMLRARLAMTGKALEPKHYMMAMAGLMVAALGASFYFGLPLFLGFAVGSLLSISIPHLVVNFLIKRRIAKFNEKFPDAIDLMVRGLRSGLPISETLVIVANELEGPIAVEFKAVADRIRIGRTMEEALQEAADRLGTAEFQFFCITLAIQRETGGNLAETLSNLSDVLRKRAQMKLKIRALSSEAKASAYIVGALPFLVFGIVTLSNPSYTAGFFTDTRLMIAGGIGICLMATGGFIMYKMVNFEF